MNDLEKYFYTNNKRLIHKWTHFFEIYDRHFSRYRNKKPVILEIGVSQGGSLQMWKEYFGPGTHIYGIDVEPQCKSLEEENISIFIGSQSDRTFLRNLKARIPEVDILIDDGGHTMQQQIITFEELFDHVKSDGIYLCEDTHTSYWLRYGGGYKRKGTFIEFSKNFVDYLHAWHSEQKSLSVNHYSKTIGSVHFYDSIVVFEKQQRERPEHQKTGTPSFQRQPLAISKNAYRYRKVKDSFIGLLNKILRAFRIRSVIWK